MPPQPNGVVLFLSFLCIDMIGKAISVFERRSSTLEQWLHPNLRFNPTSLTPNDAPEPRAGHHRRLPKPSRTMERRPWWCDGAAGGLPWTNARLFVARGMEEKCDDGNLGLSVGLSARGAGLSSSEPSAPAPNVGDEDGETVPSDVMFFNCWHIENARARRQRKSDEALSKTNAGGVGTAKDGS